MTKILFVCHGNICRSPMAEFVMKDIVEKAGLSHAFHIESAGTSTEEIGNSVYPPVQKLLKAKGISTQGKTARQIEVNDYDNFDYIVGMDGANIRNMVRLFEGDPLGKVSLLLEHADRDDEVADPWYTRDFQTTYDDVYEGCHALFDSL